MDHIKASSPEFNSSKLSYRSANAPNGINLEFLRTSSSLHLYLYVRSQIIPPCKHDQKKAIVTILTDEGAYTEEAARLEGGQKVLISDPLRDKIIEALKKNLPVTIRLQGYSTTIDPQDFSDYLEKMDNPPFSLRFRLPF